MTLVATPSSLSIKASDNDIDLFACDSTSSLEHTSCSLDRVPGFNYYKYGKEDGSSFLTTVSPKTWGESCPHTFLKVYRETKNGLVSQCWLLCPFFLLSSPLLHDHDPLSFSLLPPFISLPPSLYSSWFQFERSPQPHYLRDQN